jgi:hypothetical protein
MRRLLLPLCLFLLAGCGNVVYLDSDSFEIGAATPERFEADGEACRNQAGIFIATDPRALEDGNFERHRDYNRVFTACMTARHYRPRPYLQNLLP